LRWLLTQSLKERRLQFWPHSHRALVGASGLSVCLHVSMPAGLVIFLPVYDAAAVNVARMKRSVQANMSIADHVCKACSGSPTGD